MIKLLACIFMLIDHVGVIFFPNTIAFRLIGRLAMPLFSFSIARGFYFSFNKGSLLKYKKHMLIFALLSQVPYMLMVEQIGGNIGFLWLICLLFLERAEKKSKTFTDYFIMYFMVACSTLAITDYGIYGFGFTLILYYFVVKNDFNLRLYVGYVLVHVICILQNYQYGLMQLFTLPALSLINIMRKYDDIIKPHKLFFYIFYPAHILILLLIKQFLR